MPHRHRARKSSASVFTRIEEVVLASSGADAFELVFSLAAARLFAERKGHAFPRTGAALRRAFVRLVEGAAHAWPGLDPSRTLEVSGATLQDVLALLGRVGLEGEGEALDALFEQLVARVAKGDKGQFFTPRPVVDFAVRGLGLRDGETFLDPACGSGAFVAHARAAARVRATGADVDARAVRVAKLLSVATRADPGSIVRKDSLACDAHADSAPFDVIATNPPFAGETNARGFELARLGGRVERDVLFLERCVSLLRPGGRLAIVLPYGKIAAARWAPLRAWLVERMRVLAVVSLPRETFLPHTSQRAVLVFAKKRRRRGAHEDERVLLAVSERAGRDASGEPIVRAERRACEVRPGWRDVDHDLGELEESVRSFLRAEGFMGRA